MKILIKCIKYKILEQCINSLFQAIYRNFAHVNIMVFKTGDVVRIRDKVLAKRLYDLGLDIPNNRNMCVEKIQEDKEYVSVVFFNTDGDLCRESFNPDILEKVS